jgi:IS30 family transposase
MTATTSPRGAGGRPRVDVDPARVRELLAQGVSVREIARRLRRGYGTIHRAVQALDRQSGVIQNRSLEGL